MASIITLPDSRILSYALDSTPENGPVVLLANSLCAPYNLWNHVVPALNNNGFRTLRYDQPGHGSSSAPKGLDSTMDSMADDVHALVQNSGISKIYSWVGISVGAAVGIYFATKYPGLVSKLAICDTISSSPVNAGLDDPFGARVAAARQAGHMEDITQAQWVRRVMLGTTIEGFESCCHALRSPDFDLRPRFATVGAAVDGALCVVGEKDANLPQTMMDMKEKIKAGFKTAGKDKEVKLVVIKSAGHICFIDGSEQFRKAIISFLKG